MSWDLLEKSITGTGSGWDYNESELAYDQDVDTDTGSDVFYNGLGTQDTWSNISKS